MFVFLVSILLLPFLQLKLNIIDIKPLNGSFEKADYPQLKWFTWKSWFNERFQTNFNKSIEDNIGFKNLLIRLNNQLDYSLYRKTLTQKAIIGKSDCLYEEGYILDYCGKNFVGRDSINKTLYKLKILQEYLKKQKNIDLIIVFEPGKASYFPEYIPDRYEVENKKLSNYLYYAQQCRNLKINHLDLNSWFLTMKGKTKFPLFPKYGVHWSTYGMCLATDTLLKFIEKTHNIDMNDISINKLNISNKLKDVDFDIELTLNLLLPLPHETMAYPEIIIESSENKIKPNVLVIADSYYWSIFNSNIPQKVFNHHQFWYYNKTIYPDIWGESARYVNHADDIKVIDNQDIILVMLTELNLCKTFFGFIDSTFNMYNLEYKIK